MPDSSSFRQSSPDGFHGHYDPVSDTIAATAPPPFDAVLARAQTVADQLAARATATDQADRVPAENVAALAEAGLLGLTIPNRFGGHGASGFVVRRYSEIMAAACGVTTFVHTQHLSAGSQIAASGNAALQAETLPALATGQVMCGVAFSHVRRPGPPMMRVEPTADGYRFDGVAPWFTGWGTMDAAVIAGTLPSGDYLFAYTPVRDHPRISASAPLRLAAMNASMTVTLTCHRLIVPRDRLVKIVTPREMAASDAASFLRNTAYSLGVARAAARLLRAAPSASDTMRALADLLDDEREAARADADRWEGHLDDPDYATEALRIRAWCIDLGVRAGHAAVVATGGAANLLNHPAQRLYREALHHSLVAQSAPVRAASLDRLLQLSRQSLADSRAHR